MTSYHKITYLGIAAFSLVCATVFLGITRLNFTMHKLFGVATFCLAASHLGTIVYQKRKKN